MLAREIERNPKILLVGQPTRGVDIGAIEFIHKRIVAQRDAGKALLLVSVELDEIFALSDRIIVLCAGRVTGERRPEDTNAQDLGLLMAGVSARHELAQGAGAILPLGEVGRGVAPFLASAVATAGLPWYERPSTPSRPHRGGGGGVKTVGARPGRAAA